MIAKELLESVVAFEKGLVMLGDYRCTDTYRLHFRQWWKPSMLLQYERVTTNVEPTNMTFHHESTPASTVFHQLLIDHIVESYNGTAVEAVDIETEECTILKLVPEIEEKDKEE